MTSTELATLTTTVIAALIAIIPPLGKWLSGLPQDEQAAVKGLSALAIAIAFIALGCFNLIQGIPCEVKSIADFIFNVVIATVLGFGSLTAATIPYSWRAGRKERSLAKSKGA